MIMGILATFAAKGLRFTGLLGMAKPLTLEAAHRIGNIRMDRQPVKGNIKLLREGRPRVGEDEVSSRLKDTTMTALYVLDGHHTFSHKFSSDLISGHFYQVKTTNYPLGEVQLPMSLNLNMIRTQNRGLQQGSGLCRGRNLNKKGTSTQFLIDLTVPAKPEMALEMRNGDTAFISAPSVWLITRKRAQMLAKNRNQRSWAVKHQPHNQKIGIVFRGPHPDEKLKN